MDNKNYQKLSIIDYLGNTGFVWACIHQPELAEIMLNNSKGLTGYDLAKEKEPQIS